MTESVIMGGIHPPARRPLPDASQARLYRALGLDHANTQLFAGLTPSETSLRVVSTPSAPVKTKPRKSKVARDVARSESVGVPASRGG